MNILKDGKIISNKLSFTLTLLLNDFIELCYNIYPFETKVHPLLSNPISNFSPIFANKGIEASLVYRDAGTSDVIALSFYRDIRAGT